MSAALKVWCALSPEAATATDAVPEWRLEVTECGDDVPARIAAVLPGLAHAVELRAVSGEAPKAVRTAMRKAAQAIARAAHGVIEDLEAGTIEVPSGVKRTVPIKHPQGSRVALLRMSWWLGHTALLERDVWSTLLTTLEDSLPEAMPRRYGPHEPPRHVYAETGRDHLLEFLIGNPRSIVWFGHSPIESVHPSVPDVLGWTRWGDGLRFRASRLSIAVDAAVLEQPGWLLALDRAWRRISRVVRPFYGDVRTERGWLRRGNGLSDDGSAEEHPVQAWWWRGLPRTLGHAAVVGEPYAALWPELRGPAREQDGLLFVTTGDWRDPSDLVDRVGRVPEHLAHEFDGRKVTLKTGGVTTEYPERYAEVFPFPRPDPSTPR